MSITKNDIETIWDKLGLAHVGVDEVTRYVNICLIPDQDRPLNPEEEHFLNTLIAQMKAAGEAINIGAGFLQDWLKENGKDLLKASGGMRPITNREIDNDPTQ